MSTSYAAKPRGRRETETQEQDARVRASSGASQRLSKVNTRVTEESTTPRNSRPSSPALFLQRNRAADNSRPTESILVSPRGSLSSLKSERMPANETGDETPKPINSTKSSPTMSKRSMESDRGSAASVGFGLDNLRRSMAGSQSSLVEDNSPTPRAGSEAIPRSSSELKRSSGASTASIAKMQPKVTSPSEEDISVRKGSDASSVKSSSSRHSTKNPEIQPYQAPNTATPTMSPPQSPTFQHHMTSNPSGHQNPYAYPPYGVPNQQGPGGFYPMPFTPPQPPQSAPPPETARALSPENDADRQRLLEKVSGVLPDINRLLDHYQETQGQLTAKDLLMKQSELQRNEENSRLRFEIGAKKEEYEKVIERLVGENYRYKLDTEEHTRKIAVLQQAAKDHQFVKEEHEALKLKYADMAAKADAARLAKEQLLSDKLKLENNLEDTKRKRATDYETHKRTVKEMNDAHRDQLDAKDRDHSRAAAEHKMVLSKVQLELANLITKHSQQKKDTESAKAALAALDEKMAAKIKEHEAAMEETAARHSQQLETQLQSLTTQHEENVKTLTSKHEEELTDVKSKHEGNVKELQEKHEASVKEIFTENEAKTAKLVEEHQTKMEEVKGELDQEKSAHTTLQTEHGALTDRHAEFTGGLMSWRKRQEEWQQENEKFNKLIETLGGGEAAEDGEGEVGGAGEGG